MDFRRKDLLNKEPTLNKYQELCDKTRKLGTKTEFQEFCYYVFKLAGEAGEVSEKMGKLLREQGIDWGSDPKTWPNDIKEAFKLEQGDVLWYISAIASSLGYSLQEIAEANIEKLQSRQDRGMLHGNGDNR